MVNLAKSSIQQLLNDVKGLDTAGSLKVLAEQFPGKITFSSSFSYEDQVITHDILTNKLNISIFTLDTGRLFAETYSVWNSTNDRYHTRIKAYYPNHRQIEEFVEINGPNSFYESVENRKSCCHIRKVEPLGRALAGNAIWVTGLRAEHSTARKDLTIMEWDETNQVIKYHPILYWTTKEVIEYIKKEQIPYNPLHDRGFVSIGCAPCTRAVKPGEDFRAGRWWWEDESKKECGLHGSSAASDTSLVPENGASELFFK
ncbi:MAG: phosphoadenylyl-sulfate reductase [Chitinophagaceae bacterium]